MNFIGQSLNENFALSLAGHCKNDSNAGRDLSVLYDSAETHLCSFMEENYNSLLKRAHHLWICLESLCRFKTL